MSSKATLRYGLVGAVAAGALVLALILDARSPSIQGEVPSHGTVASGTEGSGPPSVKPPDPAADRVSISGDVPSGSFRAAVRVVPKWAISRGKSTVSLIAVPGEGAVAASLELGADGAWEGDLPDGAYQATEVLVDGCVFDVGRPESLSPAHPEIVLELMGVKNRIVRVIDAYTRQPLHEAEVFAVDHGDAADIEEGKYERPESGASVRGPGEGIDTVDLGSPPSMVAWSPGYKAEVFALFPFARATTVALVPAGSLRVTLVSTQTGSLPEGTPVELRLRKTEAKDSAGRYGVLKPCDVGDSVNFAGLPAGNYLLTVRMLSAVEAGAMCARKEVHVSAGLSETTTVEVGSPLTAVLHLVVLGREMSKSELHDVDIWVRYREPQSFGDGWTTDGLESLASWSCEHAPTGYPHLDTALERTYENLAPGRYEVMLAPYGYSREVELSSGGRAEVVFDLSGLARVEVMALAPAPETSMRVFWGRAENPGEATGWSSLRRNMARIECEPGLIWIQLVGAKARSAPVLHEAVPGEPSRVEMRADPSSATVLEVTVEPAGMHIPLDLLRSVEIRAYGHTGRVDFLTFELNPDPMDVFDGVAHSAAYFMLSEPGGYRVEYHDLRGVARSLLVTASQGVTRVTLSL